MAAVTVTAAALMIAIPASARQSRPTERRAEVTLCQVQLGSVEQVTALTGALRYEGEHAVISPATGLVREVYVAAGDRVKAGDALFRLDGQAQAAAVSAAIARQAEGTSIPASAYGVDLSGVNQAAAWESESALTQAQMALEALTVRAAVDGVVQQVLVTENGGVAAGSPGVAMSGEKQVIQCAAVLRDAEQLRPGLTARILHDGEMLCMGQVTAIGAATVVNGQTVCQVDIAPEEAISLPLGATVSAEVIRASAENVPVLPVSAADGMVRWVSEGRAYTAPVTVLLADESLCWVDLPVGTQVVLSGEETVEGQRIREVPR